MLKLAPSILSADFSRLGEQIQQLYNSGVSYIHIDVMDGHFVPNISFGVPIISSIRKYSDLVFDVHLMIENPEKFVDQIAEAGADIINFHLEATKKPDELIKKIRDLGKSPAVTLKLETPLEAVYDIASKVDMILLMSIEPGFGGQKLKEEALKKATDLRKFLLQHNLSTEIQMDGGINTSNAKDVIASGVNILVAGSAIFCNDSIETGVKEFFDIFETIDI